MHCIQSLHDSSAKLETERERISWIQLRPISSAPLPRAPVAYSGKSA